ncbi:MAG: type II toxin-antitoxin system RelE/ParE family toxin [Deltaproteobacteria bacterium]|nr:type II toxin-antitoxin system RelE/ParE family toxin [Deltaproteobacteria bacterium]
MKYAIEFSPVVESHLTVLTARQRRIVLSAIEQRLSSEPGVETKNRKPMRPNPLAPWELRVGNLRVYYDIDETAGLVVVLAVGTKEGNMVRIGGEVIEL